MKKISIIAAGLLLATTSVMAQHKPYGKNIIGHQKAMTKLEKSRQMTKMLAGGHANTANKSTISIQRMKAMSEYGQETQNGPIVFFDSLAFTYSGMNGSSFDYNSMSIGYFDPVMSPMTPANMLLFFPDIFNIYAPNLVAGYTLTYDVNNRLTEMYLDDVQGGQDERVLMTYNNDKLVLVQDLMDNGGGNWDTTYKRYFAYDVNDLLITDSLMENQGPNVWAINQKYVYTYDANGNITNLVYNDSYSGTYGPDEEDNYTYNGNDQMVTATYAYYNSTSMMMELSNKDSFEYTPGFEYYTKDNYYSWDDVNSVWETQGYNQRTLNAQMKPEMAQGYGWDGSNYEQSYEERYVYNTAGNPIHDSVYSFTNGSIDDDPVYIIHYYYEDYSETAVDHIAAAKSDITVYPNPATDLLTITNSSNEAMQVQLVNALGQTVKKARATGTGKLSIGDLTAGMYWLTVTDAKGAKLHTQAIVKQ